MSSPVYRPPWWLPGRDLQTVVPSLWPLPDGEFRPERIWVAVAPGSEVLALVDRPQVDARGTLVLFHGLGGSADSGYMQATAREALRAGWLTARVNLRNCGGTESRSRTLYSAAQSDDVGLVLLRLAASCPAPHVAAGFSLGGSLVLRYAGSAGTRAAGHAFASVSAPLDLAWSVRALEHWRNRVYHEYYLAKLRTQIRRVRQVRSCPGPSEDRLRIRSLRQFDDLFTAPDSGYASAEEYYRDASSAPLLGAIQRPALLLAAANDPFVPGEMYAGVQRHPALEICMPRHGGHCGFWQRGQPRYWVATKLLSFAARQLHEGE